MHAAARVRFLHHVHGMAAAYEGHHYTLNDGLGDRWVATQPPHGLIEVLRLTNALATPAIEAAIRTRAARWADLDAPVLGAVRRVERDETGLRVIGEAVAGTRLSDLLIRLEASGEILSDAAAMELTGGVIRALATLHKMPGGLAHGAVSPAHIVVGHDGSVVLTDGVFGPALESLQWGREKLWRELHLALPASASLPRFDQRADVTQAAAVALAIALRRPLRVDEYPRATIDLVVAATSDAAAPGASALRMWLQQAFQLQSRSMFASAVDADRAFADITATPGLRRAGMKALGQLLQPPRLLIA
jgi:hypothetical protein